VHTLTTPFATISPVVKVKAPSQEKGRIFGANRISAAHGTNNPNSGAAMRMCGMSYEGTTRQAAFSNQGVYDPPFSRRNTLPSQHPNNRGENAITTLLTSVLFQMMSYLLSNSTKQFLA
jgi:hypothetical protein